MRQGSAFADARPLCQARPLHKTHGLPSPSMSATPRRLAEGHSREGAHARADLTARVGGVAAEQRVPDARLSALGPLSPHGFKSAHCHGRVRCMGALDGAVLWGRNGVARLFGKG